MPTSRRGSGRSLAAGAREREIELAVWRAGVDEQLRSIRSDIADLRAHVVAMFVVVAGAAAGQVVMRLVTGK